MTKKKARAKYARKIRKETGLPFVTCCTLAKVILRFTTRLSCDYEEIKGAMAERGDDCISMEITDPAVYSDCPCCREYYSTALFSVSGPRGKMELGYMKVYTG